MVMLRGLLESDGVREHVEIASRVGFLALHGGLERGTYEIAREASARSGASLYAVVQPAELRSHIPSSEYDPAHSDALAAFLDHVDVAISVHGYGGLRTSADRWTTVLVGGAHRSLAAQISERLRVVLPEYTFLDEIDRMPETLRGVHVDNPVNRVNEGGVQFELPPRIRGYGRWWDERDPGGPAPGTLRPHTEALVATLAEHARASIVR